MTFRLKKTVVMVGMMGAGKTSVGNALARALRVAFLDSDDEIVRAANRSIAEIFERDGEAFFRDRETAVIRRLLEGTPAILSVGGGAFLTGRNQRMISTTGIAVWLRADIDLLWQRVRHKTTRPLLQTRDPRGTLCALYEKRRWEYAKADLVVDTRPEYSIERTAEEVIRALLGRPDVLERA